MTCAQTRHMTAQLLCVPLPLSLVVVIEMKKVVPHKKGSSIGRVLRFLRMNRRVEQSPSYQEIAYVPTPTDSYHSHPKELKAALLEAERRKAEALMKWQKRPFIC
jgi:hypothetical protein